MLSFWQQLTILRDRLAAGHIRRHEGLVKVIMEGGICGKNGPEGPDLSVVNKFRVM